MGIGLDSSEVGHPPEKFAQVFARCKALGFRLVAHAGEEGPPEYIWSALDILKVERIDHGVQATRDAALMQRLATDRIALTVCPLSNQKLKVFPDLKDHSLRQLLDAGLCAMLNSDDPAYFGGYMNDNWLATFSALKLDASHAMQLATNSIQASFCDAAMKRQYQDRIIAVVADFC